MPAPTAAPSMRRPQRSLRPKQIQSMFSRSPRLHFRGNRRRIFHHLSARRFQNHFANRTAAVTSLDYSANILLHNFIAARFRCNISTMSISCAPSSIAVPPHNFHCATSRPVEIQPRCRLSSTSAQQFRPACATFHGFTHTDANPNFAAPHKVS